MREEQKSLTRKREEEDLAKWQAETADREKEEKYRKGMLANDERELNRQEDWANACWVLANL